MAKRGRPRVNNDDRKMVSIHIRVTNQEYLDIMDAADLAEYKSMSDFIRSVMAAESRAIIYDMG